MKSIFIFILLNLFLFLGVFGQNKEDSYNCKFLSQFIEYIKVEHQKRVNAFDSIGGKFVYSMGKNGVIYENSSLLSDSAFEAIVKSYDLINFLDDPLVGRKYRNNIIVDTLKFFQKNCDCILENNNISKYQVSHKWIINENIPPDTQLIRLANVMVDKRFFVLVFNSNRSPYYHGYFHFSIEGASNVKLEKIKWAQPEYDIDGMELR